MPNNPELDDSQWGELAGRAAAAQLRAYAPYSDFSVGAALLTTDGRVFEGVNVENSSYGLTICAERTAACAAVAAGAEGFSALAVATEDGASMCGACRQFLYEWGGGLLVRVVDKNGELGPVTTLEELLPGGFRFGGDA